MGDRSKRDARVYVCRGSDCKKRPFDEKCLRALGRTAEVHVVGCQKVCKAPVVGVDDGRGARWFERADGKKTKAALARWAETGVVKKTLEKRESRKRAGKLKGKGKRIDVS